MATRPERLVAHTPPEGSDDWHYLEDHLRDVADLAGCFAKPFGGDALAWWAGILHDLGKAHPEFQNYLWKNFLDPKSKHKTVDHKTAGAIRSREIGGEPLCQIIHGHHGGLSDKGELNTKLRGYLSGELERLRISLERFDHLELLSNIPEGELLPAWFRNTPLELDMLMRMVFSALVDADALDTEAHWHGDRAELREREWPPIEEIEQRFLIDQSALVQAAHPVTDSPVNAVRDEVYEACVAGAERPTGFFRMTVPTGGGKTRSGLAFALRHARVRDLRRIIVAVPFITITEQTADVYRRAVGADALIEHHGGLEPTNRKNLENVNDAEHEDERRRQLMTQNWDAPLIVTTSVQLFGSLFTNRTSKARKLHNLAGSVIILDEIQTLPPNLRGPVFEALRELVDHYRVSVVLSTATQPVLDTIVGDLERDGHEVVELAPEPKRLFSVLKRVEYEFPCLDERWHWERVAEEMRASSSAMAIVNTIKDAAALYDTLGDDDGLHLSTRMCGAHRRAVLEDVRERLHRDKPCRLVSTQLVEAGVDLDFPVVLRALAPLDRIVQAAGRCNREGRLNELGRVVVFRAEEDKMPPGVYRQGADETLIMLKSAGLDMHDPAIFEAYFTRLYGLTDADRYEVQKLRSGLAFASVDEAFEIIRDDTFPVLVPYPQKTGNAERIDAWNRARQRLFGYRPGGRVPLRALMRDVQPWLVSCRRRERERLLREGAIAELVPDVLWEWAHESTYDRRRGITDGRVAPETFYV
jgi:CRISPR-associated endonuclease/helicase Cas3